MTLLLTIFVVIIAASLSAVAVFSHRQKRNPKAKDLIAAVGIVDKALNPTGTVLVHGELWSAQSNSGSPVSSGARVKVASYQNGLLFVDDLNQSTS